MTDAKSGNESNSENPGGLEFAEQAQENRNLAGQFKIEDQRKSDAKDNAISSVEDRSEDQKSNQRSII